MPKYQNEELTPHKRTTEAIYESLDTMADNALNQLRKFITVNGKSWAELEAESGNIDVSEGGAGFVERVLLHPTILNNKGTHGYLGPNNWIHQKN